jgi:FMN-dependent NADH-azoreductase
MNVLYIDSCVRENSRTAKLAQYFLGKLDSNAHISQVNISSLDLPPVDAQFLKMRDNAVASGDFSHDIFSIAKQFAKAELIVIAAPFWDLSFPAALKQYFEHINVLGLTFSYSEQGIPISLCKAQKLVYITTAGGQIFNQEYGYGYIKALAQTFYGVKETTLFKAQELDILGADTDAILKRTMREIDSYFLKGSEENGKA